MPAACEREAAARNMGIHELLEEQAGGLKAGESGLLALDWWNGNRSVLVDDEAVEEDPGQWKGVSDARTTERRAGAAAS